MKRDEAELRMEIDAIIRDEIQDNINEYILEILSELYFLNRKLKEEVERYDLTDCDKEILFKVNEVDLFVLRTIILSKHKLVQQLSQMNISVREN